MSPSERPERVVVVTSSYPAHADDASGHFVAAEVRRLCAVGHDVTVLAPETRANVERGFWIFGPKTPHESVPGPSGERVHFLRAGDAFGWPGALARLRERPLRAVGAVRFVHAVRRELEARGPWDRLIAHFVIPSVWPTLDGARVNARVREAVLHGSDVRLVARFPAPLRRRIASVLAPFDLRCASEELRQELAHALGPDLAERARVEAAPLDVPPTPGRSEARRELGVPESARLFVVAGRLVGTKRVAVALRAARLVPNASVVVVGDGPERAALERDFPSVCFVGLVGRKRALTWVAAADALLVASREEGAPSVVREARALGTPVVALPCGDLRAWQKSDPGLLVVPASSP